MPQQAVPLPPSCPPTPKHTCPAPRAPQVWFLWHEHRPQVRLAPPVAARPRLGLRDRAHQGRRRPWPSVVRGESGWHGLAVAPPSPQAPAHCRPQAVPQVPCSTRSLPDCVPCCFAHQDGKFLKKRNTFGDFIACAQHLVDVSGRGMSARDGAGRVGAQTMGGRGRTAAMQRRRGGICMRRERAPITQAPSPHHRPTTPPRASWP